MDGWADLLKHFLSSRISSVSLLATSAVFTLGPRYFDFIPSLPDGWQWAPFAVMVFTGMQCFWWGVKGLFTGIASLLPGEVARSIHPRALSADERLLLAAVAKYGNFPLDKFARLGGFSDPLAPKVAARKLSEHGLLDLGLSGGAFLTSEGEAFVMHFRAELPQL